MSEAEIASERPEMNRKIVLGNAMTNCFPFTEESLNLGSGLVVHVIPLFWGLLQRVLPLLALQGGQNIE